MARLNLGLLATLAIFSAAPAARAASIADCGSINVQANASCEVETSGGCTANCTPINCTASLYAQCQGSCNATLPSCEVSCSANCQGQCSANANFDCSGTCNTSCTGTCQGKCTTRCQNSSDANCQANCNASCSTTCKTECDASCSANASADCSGKCQASCQGSCNASARLDCQLDCQANGYADCTGGCEVACQRPSGNLFCDGSYVDDGGNLDSCVKAIEAALNIQVSGYAESSSSCSGNSCQAQASAGGSVSCAMARLASHRGTAAGLLVFGAAIVVAGARRRRAQ